jgi:taurine dioxygenase
MQMSKVEVVPAGAPVGAEIRGVDLSRELDEETFDDIRRAFERYSVIFFRNQDISPQDQVRFSRRFGDLEILTFSQFTLKDMPEVLLISNVQQDGKYIGIHDAGREWHADSTYVPNPSLASFLYAKEVPQENGQPLGDTLFVPSAGVIEELPPALREKLSGLKSIHRMDSRLQKDKNAPPIQAIHPAVVTHPRTGRKCLFVNEGRTVGFVDFDEAEGREMLDDLLTRLKAPERIYRHKWQVGDLLLWDNIATQHQATHNYSWPTHRRLMHRTTVKGVSLH